MSPVDESRLFKGAVKWFNNKAGYGFITVVQDCPAAKEDFPSAPSFVGKDLFVHHSVIHIQEPVFRYLVPGELVVFEVTVPENGKHPYQASNVQAFNGRKLKCELQQSNKRRAPLRTPPSEVEPEESTSTIPPPPGLPDIIEEEES